MNHAVVVIAAHLAGLVLVLAFHEFGHLATGRLAGERLLGLYVGPLAWERRGGRIRFRIHGRVHLFGGAVQFQSPAAHNIRRKMLATAIGGPVASLGLAALLFAASQTSSTPPPFSLLLENLAFLSGLVGVATLLPLGHARNPTDGQRALLLLRNSVGASQLIAEQLALSVVTQTGVPSEDLCAGLLEALRADRPGPDRAFVPYAGHVCALVTGDLETADGLLEAARGAPDRDQSPFAADIEA